MGPTPRRGQGACPPARGRPRLARWMQPPRREAPGAARKQGLPSERAGCAHLHPHPRPHQHPPSLHAEHRRGTCVAQWRCGPNEPPRATRRSWWAHMVSPLLALRRRCRAHPHPHPRPRSCRLQRGGGGEAHVACAAAPPYCHHPHPHQHQHLHRHLRRHLHQRPRPRRPQTRCATRQSRHTRSGVSSEPMRSVCYRVCAVCQGAAQARR